MTPVLKYRRPDRLSLVVTGEADEWQDALTRIVGPQVLTTYRVQNDRELLDVVRSGVADAAVLDEEISWDVGILQLLRMIRRVDAVLPVVLLIDRPDRRLLESALQLAAFSVVAKPLELEELLRQIQGIMTRLDRMLRDRE